MLFNGGLKKRCKEELEKKITCSFKLGKPQDRLLNCLRTTNMLCTTKDFINFKQKEIKTAECTVRCLI